MHDLVLKDGNDDVRLESQHTGYSHTIMEWNRGNKMDIEKAKFNPAAKFKTPQEVASCLELSREQKIEILQRWEQDATAMEVAEEEGMTGPQTKLLQPIRDALHTLNHWPDMEHSSPSKA